ncbi:MAG TPA: hypothetical protein VKA67_02390, partial [Verrucomicrobiae bacterium]|nr:hypothetical protein [Verrucomicrobiae bacterium]
MALLTALPDQILSVNLVPAERGNPGAMREIGEAIQRCAYAVTTSNTKFEAQQIDAQLRSEAAANRSGRPVTTAEEAQKVEKAVENKKALDESCSHIDPKQIGSGLRWLERAADAGDLQAMRDYIQTAFDGYLEHGMQPSDLDEAKRRRDRVRQYA